jgi:hypothetical protein
MSNLKSIDLPALMRETIQTPQIVVPKITGLNLSRHTLLMGLALITALNVIVYAITGQIYPPKDPGVRALYAPIVQTPLLFAGFMYVVLALVCKFISSVGQSIGGRARHEDILALIIWLQALRLIVSVIAMVFTSISPGLTSLFTLGAGIWGMYIHIVFVDEALGFHNRVKAALLTVLVYLGVTVGIVLSLMVVFYLIFGA